MRVEEVMHMARVAGLQDEFGVSEFAYTDRLQHFAALVAASVPSRLTEVEKQRDGLLDALKFARSAYWGQTVGNSIRRGRDLEVIDAAIASAVCETCDGRGVVGGFVNADSGYQDDPCPDCTGGTA